jgi:UDP-2,3-diacylglucosamine pyrophosphatase LpxH
MEASMHTTLYVISDLHLGGAPAENGQRGFQICPPRTQARLARFIDELPGRTPDADVRLVLAGDIVDFLAEEPFEAFTADGQAAHTKLKSIIKNTQPVWTALQDFVGSRRGGALTLMLGNHDLELCLPGVRRLLFDTIGEGRVEFLYDNQAYTYGPVLIEHGNRFDEWNAVPHGALRRVRSQLSRGDTTSPFPALPGSQLVVEVMNPLKKDYAFVDLLKPETAGVLPLLAALGAGSLRHIWQGFQTYRRTFAIDFDESREPRDETYIAARGDSDQELFDLAENIALGGDPTQVGAIKDALMGARKAVSAQVREYRRGALFKALRARAEGHRLAFDVEKEINTYEIAARRAVRAGHQVVVYGHTHLVKRVPLGASGGPLPVYLNTGTWADLIRVPESVWMADEAAARIALRDFVTDLEGDTVERWQRAVPTFAKVELDGDVVTSSDVYFADEGGSARVTTAGLLQRLTREK